MRISDWSSTCALPICSVFFFSLGQKTERPFDTLRANGRGGIAIFVSDTKPTLYSIPVHRAFADALAAGLIARHADGALGLAEGLILLPSNRARGAVQAAFVRAGGSGLLMPRLAVIGDADLDESVALALDAIDDDPIQPPIDP